jgi:hypothetical protein
MTYATSTGVLAFTRHLADGEESFSEFTRPSSDEVAAFVEQINAHLDGALAKYGFSTPLSNGDAILICREWGNRQGAKLVELTQRGAGFSEAENERVSDLDGMYDNACAFVYEQSLGFKRLGAAVTHPESEGVQFTALDIRSSRSDPLNTGREQSKFYRGQWDA